VPPEGVLPLYVRDHVAYTTLERSQGLGGNPPRPNMPDDSGQIVMTAMQATDLDTMVQMDAAVQTFPWTRRNFSDALAAGYDTCVLRTAQDILGFCILMHAPDVSHLLILTVAPAWQRQGLGSRLVNWCVERARTRGTQGLLVEVRPSNHAACALYTQQNFLQVGVRQAYYAAADGQREDAWVMQKSFANAPIGEH
jgi:tRNA threonylcarbamoyladenosine biosynthesis protein TsaB